MAKKKANINTMNPFLGGLMIKTRAILKYIRLEFYFYYKGNEVTAKPYLKGKNIVDVKLSEHILTELLTKEHKKCSRDVVFYMIAKLKADHDIIELNKNKMANTLYSYEKSSIHDALKDLEQMDIISCIKPHLYYVNPVHIFKGSQVEFIEKASPFLVYQSYSKRIYG